MIELKNLNKYFYKNKKNEIHVINNTSLKLGNNGLVALLGPSGCGKTTLLNVIGGLDDVRKGDIYVDGEKLNSSFSYKTDEIRNKHIGYIFQDYKLMENKTVFENVAVVLQMIGLKDKKEIKERVEFVLDKVGILRYKKRPVSMLSGGERQRVGIARAIVKDPDIILADEPTGNLDSKNSLEVMKIIKAISKEKLIILVTHEKTLANFYASRIVELEDGKVIADYENDHDNELDFEVENDIYLKDFKYISKQDEYNNINVYKNTENKIDVDLVVQNGNIYIRSNTNLKVEVVDNESTIDLIDDHYKQINKKDILDYNFEFDKIKYNHKKKYSSITSLFKSIIDGFKTVFKFPILKKILLIGFVLSGIFIFYSVASIASLLNVEEIDFMSTNKNYLQIENRVNTINSYNSYDFKNIEYVIPGNSQVGLTLTDDTFYELTRSNIKAYSSIVNIDYITKDDLLMGRMPENDREIVVDSFVIDYLFKYNEFETTSFNLFNYEDFIGKNLSIPYLIDYEIVGISSTSNPSIYVDESMIIPIIYYNDYEFENSILEDNLIDINLVDYKLVQGKLPTKDYQTIIPISLKDTYAIGDLTARDIGGKKLEVVGYYTADNLEALLVNSNTVKYSAIINSKNISVYVKDVDKALEENKNLKLKDTYTYSKEKYMASKIKAYKTTLAITLIILSISLLEVLFMIRASFLTRVKEVGVLRAIGVKKTDIYKMFLGEIIAISTVSSLVGVLASAYVLNSLSVIGELSSYFTVNIFTIVIAIIVVYLFNIIMGLIPVISLVTRKPAEILSREDVD